MTGWCEEKASKRSVSVLSSEFIEFQKMFIKSSVQFDSHIKAEEIANVAQNHKIDSIIELITKGNESYKRHSEKIEQDIIGLLKREYYTNMEIESKMTCLKGSCKGLFIDKELFDLKVKSRNDQIKELKLEHTKDIKHLKTMAYLIFIVSATSISSIVWLYSQFKH